MPDNYHSLSLPAPAADHIVIDLRGRNGDMPDNYH